MEHQRPIAPLSIVLLPFLIALMMMNACSRPPKGNADDGKRWFSLYRCNGCHGDEGRGGRGPMIAGTELSFKRFYRKLRAPGSEIMPVFPPDRLSDQDAADIYLWLRTTQRAN